ncbi:MULTISPECIES: DUF3006 domain-containing protein [Deinococcus]|uniref:DUF3006 domain-containing protein n=1 Tax=Deinococcus TaxID=1298 RepID=UPI000480C2C4|nr:MULTISPECIES: DUF3006 domain-containing protein [Deinococcus]KEF34877.1 hypothetical protein RDMS_04740 [Deinococcus sp. RL]
MNDGPERWTVDAIEDSPQGPLARVERSDGLTFDVPLHALPAGVREGDLLGVVEGPDGVTLHLLPAETATQRRAAQRRLDALNAEGGEEEITL